MYTPTFRSAGDLPSSRYVLPQFEERTAYGFKRQDPYNKLFEDRVIFLGVQVDDASADDVMAQLLVLESQDAERDITMYINSPGGSFTAMTAIYDTMQYVAPQIQTVVLGQAASAAAVLLAAGAPGKRLALPNARVLIHQPAMGRPGTARPPTSRSRPRRSSACARGSRRPSPGTPSAPGAGEPRHRPRQHPLRIAGAGVRHRRPGAHDAQARLIPIDSKGVRHHDGRPFVVPADVHSPWRRMRI